MPGTARRDGAAPARGPRIADTLAPRVAWPISVRSTSPGRSSPSSSRPSGSANPLAVKIGLADAPPFRLAWMRFLLGVYQGAVVAGFNFVMNMRLLQICRPRPLATCALATPIFGVLVSAAAAGEPLTPTLFLSSLMVAAGVGLATRR